MVTLKLNKYSFLPETTAELVDDELQKLKLTKNDISSIYVQSGTIIGEYAFKDFYNVEWIGSINATKQIKAHAFENCTKLYSHTPTLNVLDIRNTTAIEDYAFANCSSLSSLNVSSAKKIGNYAFNGCTSLTAITIPASISAISNGTFQNCSKLKTIANIKQLTAIGDYAFASCYNFPAKIELKECTEIGRYAFLSCQNLSNLNAQKCTFVDYNAFYGTHLWDVDPQQ